MKNEEEGRKCGLQNQLEIIPGAPHRDTIRRWEMRQLRGDSLETNTANWGAPPLMTEGEKQVLGGWVLLRERGNKITSGTSVVNFVMEHFGVSVDSSWVSRTLRSLGFSSQYMKTAFEERPMYTKMPEMKKFIQSVRELLDDGVALSRIVCADEVGFWNSGVVTRSYAIRGG